MINQAQLNRVVERVVAGYSPEAIGIFGSYSTGRATDKSDLDLVVIKRTHEPAHRRSAHVRHLLPSLRKIDVVVLTPDELEEVRRVPHTFHYTVLEQLQLIYVRPGVDRAALGL